MKDDVFFYETKTGLGGGYELSGTIVSTHYKEPPLVIVGNRSNQLEWWPRNADSSGE